MKLFKYNQFLNEKPLNENLDKAKKLMKDRYLLRSAAEDLGLIKGELKAQLDHKEKKSVTMRDFTPEQQAQIREKLKTMRLDDAQIRTLERDPEFLKIRELLGQKYIGWAYPFTYFYFIEMITIDELFTNENSIFNKLIEYSGLLDKLPKKFDQNFIDPNIPNNAEVLIDGLDSLDDYRKIKKIFDKLTPVLKKDYNDSPVIIKDQFAEVARGFDKLGGNDEEKKEKLMKSFFGEVRTIEADQVIYGKAYKKGEKRYFGPLNRYQNIREFIKAAQNYLKSSDDDNIMAFYEKMNKCNDRLGALGADVMFEENGILIIEVRSFQANQFLNGHTRHCIKDSLGQWRNYVSDHYNKQYYIYNFNIPQYDNMSTIGITIEPKQKVRACHALNDASISNIKEVLRGWEKKYDIKEDLFSFLKPMSDEEIKKKERAKLAEREIVKKGVSKEKIIEYVKEDGADINKDNGIALLNSVEENDYEKAKTILELGGSPNLRTKADAVINKAVTLDMIKLLVSYGSELTSQVFNNIGDDYDAIEFCLKQGLDPNFDNCLPVRKTCKGSYKSPSDIGKGNFDIFLLLLRYGARLSDDTGRVMAVKWAAEFKRIEFIEHMIKLGYKSGFKQAAVWLKHSRKLNDKDKDEINRYLEQKAKEFGE